jgi:hypothetical protein
VIAPEPEVRDVNGYVSSNQERYRHPEQTRDEGGPDGDGASGVRLYVWRHMAKAPAAAGACRVASRRAARLDVREVDHTTGRSAGLLCLGMRARHNPKIRFTQSPGMNRVTSPLEAPPGVNGSGVLVVS